MLGESAIHKELDYPSRTTPTSGCLICAHPYADRDMEELTPGTDVNVCVDVTISWADRNNAASHFKRFDCAQGLIGSRSAADLQHSAA